MAHYKMGYTYVGVDSHKETHTAVFIDCFYERLGEIVFQNRPAKFGAFLAEAEKFKQGGTQLLFGMEDVSSYGRSLAAYLAEHGIQAKHVNALLVARERKNQNIAQKTDSVDAECAARVLLSKLGELPDAGIDDKYSALRALVVRRDSIIKGNISLKNHLHALLTQHYPDSRGYFACIDCKTSLAFFSRFPSPAALSGTTVDELANFLKGPSQGKVGKAKAIEILGSLGGTPAGFQEVRDEAVRSTIRQIEFNLLELERVECSMANFLKQFDCTLTSMNGIDVVTAAQMLSCIGDIRKFPTPAKLARYSGVAPVTYASGKKDLQFSNQRGNRELNSLFYCLAVRVSTVSGPTNRILNPFFYDYYKRKLSEGKTKRQAFKCVERRLVNIIWTMLTKNEEYVNPPTFDAPKEGTEETEKRKTASFPHKKTV
jgi:transposase